MTYSFIKAARVIDPVHPPCSLRSLMKVHRWLNPPVIISLREILARHREPQSSVRFLSYNTYLLDGFSINDVSLDMIYELLRHLAVDIVSLFRELAFHPIQILNLAEVAVETFLKYFLGDAWARAVAEVLGVVEQIASYIDDCLNFTTFGLWGEITDWAEVGLDMLLDTASTTTEEVLDALGISVEDILEFLSDIGIDPLSLLLKHLGVPGLIQLILTIAGSDLDIAHIGGKPEVPERALEIGRMLREPMELGPGVGIFLPYGIMALYEVFSSGTQTRIRAGLEGLNCQFLPGSGPSTSKISSGLYQIIRDLTVKNTVSIPFANCGDPWQDADYWSNKGILLSCIDMGVGVIELYSTHLYNGGDLVADPSPEDRLSRKRAQVGELINFFRTNHNPRNIAIIVGDFNLYAHKPEQKEIMNWLMQETGTLDAWDWQWQVRNIQENAGHTAETEGNISALCEFVDATGNPNTKGDFCKDPTNLLEGARIDWLLVEKPRPEHTFMLDLSRIRRRPFPRASGGFLSDHVGLDTTLITSPLSDT